MGETIRYIESDGTVHELTTPGVKYIRGEGLDVWPVEPVWENISADHSIYDGTDLRRREFSLHFIVQADSYDNVRGTVAQWRSWFLRDIARGTPGTVQIVLDNGGTYWTQASVAAPEWDGPTHRLGVIRLSFQAPGPFWYYGATVELAGTFNGTTPVNIAYTNDGDYHAWPMHKITGACGTPTITNLATGESITIGTATAVNDVLWIYTQPVRVLYIQGGTAAEQNWTGYAGTASRFFALDPGGGTIRLRAASGTAQYRVYYNIVRAGLG